MYKRILVPMDGSPLAEAALPHVQPLAKSFGTEVIVLQVIAEPDDASSVPTSPPSPAKPVRKNQTKIKSYLKKVCANLEREGINATYLIRTGGVPETILDVAKVMQADLIAMSTHGRSPARTFLLGSVTYEVVRRSPLPVLLVRSASVEPQTDSANASN